MAKQVQTHQDILALQEIKALRKGLQQARKTAQAEARRAAGNMRSSQRAAAKNSAYEYKVDLALQEQEDADALRDDAGRLERKYYARINQLCKTNDLPPFFFEGADMTAPGY